MITLVDSVVKNRWEKEFDSGTDKEWIFFTAPSVKFRAKGLKVSTIS